MSDPVSRKPEEIASNISDSEIDMILERNIAVNVNQPQNKTIGHKRQSGKRRRTYEPSGLDIAPYHKKPKVTRSTLLPLTIIREAVTILFLRKKHLPGKTICGWLIC